MSQKLSNSQKDTGYASELALYGKSHTPQSRCASRGLIFLKELTDQGRLPPYDHPLGLCLVTAGRGNTIPLKEIFDQPETMCFF